MMERKRINKYTVDGSVMYKAARTLEPKFDGPTDFRNHFSLVEMNLPPETVSNHVVPLE